MKFWSGALNSTPVGQGSYRFGETEVSEVIQLRLTQL